MALVLSAIEAYGTFVSAYPTFPVTEATSIIRFKRFHFSVRNGKRWCTLK